MSGMDLHLHLPGVTTINLGDWLGARRLLCKIFRNTERIIEMSGTAQDQVNAAFADMNAKLDSIGTDVTNISGDVDALLAQLTPGSQITPEIVAAATALQARVSGLKDSLDAVDAKVPPTV